MAGNVLIRKLSPEINESLERFKHESGIGTNSQATIRMILSYYDKVEKNNRLSKENITLQIKYEKLESKIQSYLRNKSSTEKDLKELNKLI